MPDPHDPLGPLRDLGPTPAADRFADGLEADLRIAHAESRRRSSIPWRRIVVLGPAVVLLALVATTTLVLRDDATSAALELTSARNVVVTLPDGTEVIDPADGFDLTDGATVNVGLEGTVTIDDVVLGPGAVVTVRDGQLVTDVVATTTSSRAEQPEAQAPQPSVRSDEPEPPADSRPAVSTTTVGPLRPIPLPDPPEPREVPIEPVPVPPPDPTLEPRPIDPPVDPPPDIDDSRPPVGVDLALWLRLHPADGQIRVAWVAEGVGDRPWRTLLLRSRGREVPVWRLDGETVVLAEVAGGGPGDFVDDLSGDAPARYRIVVLDAGDGVVAQSPVQSILLG